MADDQKQNDANAGSAGGNISGNEGKTSSQANASDLLNLWGASGAGSSQDAVTPPAVIPEHEDVPKEEKSVKKEEFIPEIPAEQEVSEIQEIPEVQEKEEETAVEKPIQQEMPEEPEKEERPVADEPSEGEIIASPSAAAEEEIKLLEEAGDFKSRLDEFLEELHLSRKHIFYAIGCLVLAAVLVFGGLVGLRYLKNRKPAELPPSQTPPPAVLSIEETGVPATLSVGRGAVVTQDMVGDTGVAATVAFGAEAEAVSELANYIMTFRRMQNAYQINVTGLLNQSLDRRARITSYLALLKRLDEEGSSTLQRIRETRRIINDEYEQRRQQQETDDANFFEQVNALNAQTAQNILNGFIDVTKEIVALRARYKALQKVQFFYEQALPRFADKIRSIELNQEALVAGIRVYQVDSIDLNLIVPVAGQSIGTDRLQDAAPSPAGLFPTNPAQVTTEHDYVTQPGGGFENVVRQGTATAQ